MSDIEFAKPRARTIFLITSLVVCTLVLPGAEWAYFGWLYMFTPLISFSILWRFGKFTGTRLLLSGVTLATIALVLQGNFELAIFSGTLLTCGLVLYQSTLSKDSPSISGLKGIIALGGSWLLFIALFSVSTDASPYGNFLQSMDQGINETLTYYRENSGVNSDTLVMIETTLLQMKEIVPRLLPGILGVIVVLFTWLTMVLGNLLANREKRVLPWPRMQVWQLPERLIWLTIVTGVLTLLPIPQLQWVGINILMLLCLIYTFQGLSILVFFMHKWQVPVLFRSFIYVMVVFQTLGTVILLVIGVAESWFDFRKLNHSDEPTITG